jgi:hypothetical protein
VHHVMDVYNAMAVNLMPGVTPTLSVEPVLGTELRIDVDHLEGVRLFLVVLVTFCGAVIHPWCRPTSNLRDGSLEEARASVRSEVYTLELWDLRVRYPSGLKAP